MKICVLIAVWRRPEVFRICYQKLKELSPDYCELMPVFILSAEDPDFEVNQWICRRDNYIVYKNFPLGEKMNAGISYCKTLEWDWFMGLGSDNVLHPSLFDLYRDEFERQEFFGINDVFFCDMNSRRAVLQSNYVSDRFMPVGAGRCIRRDLIQDVPSLFRDEWNWGMDGASAWTLMGRGHYPEIVETNGAPYLLDIKTRTNLTQWEELRGEAVDYDYLVRYFGLPDNLDAVGMELQSFTGFHDAVVKAAQVLPTQRDAFNWINYEYKQVFGEYRFKNYDVYRNAVTRKMR